jgi:hypothetical protein
MFSIDMS